MGFFSKLLGKDDWKKTLIKDLTVLTAVDGDMDQEEISLVYQIAINELISLMQNLGDIKDVYPTEIENKVEYIEYLLRVTFADGIVDNNEIDYMKEIVRKMKLPTGMIDDAISKIKQSVDSDQDDNVNSINKIIITSPINPEAEVQTEEGILTYFSKISKLSHPDLCTELSNVMATKHNLMMLPAGINEFQEKQQIVTDLTDKAVAICILKFGRSIIFEYGNGDLRPFNELVNSIDEEVASLNLNPMKHGCTLLDRLKEKLGLGNMSDKAIEIASGVSEKIKSFDVAKQFVLEELEAASQGNDVAINFVNNSGISKNEYFGAMNNSFKEVDSVNGPQQFLLNSCMSLGNMDLMVKIRIEVVDYIMRKWKIGKYRQS